MRASAEKFSKLICHCINRRSHLHVTVIEHIAWWEKSDNNPNGGASVVVIPETCIRDVAPYFKLGDRNHSTVSG